ncbi:hypothetical protein PTKIN_Ptkin09bG0133100 [Pterospermum kingtungense]
MEKMVVLRSIYRAACFRSSRFAAAANYNHLLGSRSFFCLITFCMYSTQKPPFSEDVTHTPIIKDPEIQNVFKDLMAASWDELPYSVVQDAKEALSKDTDDKAGQEALKNVFRAGEAV